MSDPNPKGGLRERLTAQTEDALGKLAQDLLENPLVNGAIARAFDARERASQAQELAMGALNLPSAADVERLTRRLRSVSQRLEGIEDGLDRLERRLAGLSTSAEDGGQARLAGIEEHLSLLTRMMSDLREHLPGSSAPVPQSQERLAVDPVPPPPAATRRRSAPKSAAPKPTSRPARKRASGA